MMNISLSKRLSLILFAGYFVVLLMMAITLYITIKNTNSVKLHSQSVLNSQIPQMLQLMHMDMQVLQSLNHLNEFLITGVQKDRKRFYTSLSQLNQLSKDVSLVEKLKPEISKHLSDLLRGYSDKANLVVELRESEEKNYKGISSASELLNPYHQQYIALLDSIFENQLEEAENDDNHLALARLTSTRNSWINMIMSLRVYFTTRSQRDYDRIFLYQEQNIEDMNHLTEIKDTLGFDELFVTQLADIHATWMSNLPKVLGIYQTDQWRMDTYVIRNEIYPITTQLRELIDSLLEKQKQATVEDTLLLSNELDDLTAVFKSTFGVSFLISLLVIYVVSRNIRQIVDELDKSHREAIKRSELLQKSSYELAKSLDKLQSTQSQLIEHEKMAALGNLVAGMAHEINTPIGVGVMASSHISDSTEKLEEKFEQGKIKKSDFVEFIKDTKESNEIMMLNLRRAADLIRSFKQIAVDQSTEDLREFELCDYIREVYNSLIPTFKKTNIKVVIQCPEKLVMYSYPGALAQVLTNLMNNSVIHGYQPGEEGLITITAQAETQTTIKLSYQDDGAGIDKAIQNKIFDPFFTTKRGKGGSGLGMHLLYNLVTQKLMGIVKLESASGNGVHFDITMPTRIN